jgi:drug/metabolite transporter (DMT)-like permease
VFAKFLYAAGWDFESVLVVRAGLALPLLWAWALWRVGARPLLRAPPRAILGAAAAGVLCYYVGTLLDFYALTLIAASIERVLLFSYPSMVVVLFSAIYREWPARRVVAALALTYLGILMVVTGFDLGVLRNNLAGAGLVLACALTSAIYYVATDHWARSLGSIAFTLYALTAAALCLIVHVLVRHSGPTPVWNMHTAWLMAGIVVFATVLPMLSMAEGVMRVGVQRAAVVSSIGPPTTILLGAWLLGERLSAPQWLGVTAIVAGILVLEVLPTKAPGPAPD